MIIQNANLQFRGPSPDGGKMKVVDSIVLHHRAGNGDVQSIHSQHILNGWWGIGYHFYIRKDGTIWRGRSEQWVGSHAGSSSDYNKHSLGICFEGNFETEQMTDMQVEAGRELIADIKSRYPIKEILCHRDVAKTACPGKNFRLDDLLVEDKPLKVKVGSTYVAARKIDGNIYVPLRDVVYALTTHLCVKTTEGTTSVELV